MAQEPHSALHRDALGVAGIVFLVLAAVAPLTGIVVVAALAIALGNGGGTPMSFLIVSLVLRSTVNGTQPADGTVTYRGAFHRTGTALVMVQQASDTLFAGTYSPTTVSLLRGKATLVGDRYTFTR